jgi:hypothetical protein
MQFTLSNCRKRPLQPQEKREYITASTDIPGSNHKSGHVGLWAGTINEPNCGFYYTHTGPCFHLDINAISHPHP